MRRHEREVSTEDRREKQDVLLAGKRRADQTPPDAPTNSQQSSGDTASRSGVLDVIRNKVKKLGAPFISSCKPLLLLQACMQRQSAMQHAERMHCK